MRGPTPKYYLGFGSTWTTLDSAITWTEVTDYVLSERGAGGQRGRSSELDDMRAGTFNFTLDNSTRRFDPTHTTGPYYGNLKPGVPVKITGTANAVEYPVFRGFVKGWPQDYDLSNNHGTVNVQCVDGFEKLAQAGTPSSVYALEVAADSPRAWWRLSETAGTIMGDSSGNGFHGEWLHDAVSLSGKHPNAWETISAINFDGISRVGVLPSRGILTGRPFSLELIFRLPPVDKQDDAIITDLFVIADSVTGRKAEVYVTIHNGPDPLWAMTVHYNDESSTNNVVSTASPASTETLDIDGNVYHVGYRLPTVGSAVLTLNGVTYSNVTSFSGDVTGDHVIVGGQTTDYQEARAQRGPIADVALYNADIGSTRMVEHSSAVSAPWDGDTTGERTARILALKWPSDLVDIATGYTTLGPASLNKNQLALIKGYEKAEQGRFFISRDGKATLRDRYYNVTEAAGSTSQATFSDDGAGIPYSSLGYVDSQVFNRIRASRIGGAEIEVFDDTSIDDYGEEADSSLTDIEAATDDAVRSAAEWRLVRYKDSLQRTRPIEVKLHGLTAAQQATVLGLELGHRVTIERTPQGVGSVISQETVVEGISHRISGGAWVAAIATSPTDLVDVFILDDSLLDSDAVLGY